MTEIWNLNTLCRCCHANGSFSDLNSTCNVMGSAELCTDILKYTFGIHLQIPPIDVGNTICNKCVKHLQDAAIFKKQVIECEHKFQEYCKNELLQHMNIKIERDDHGEHDVMVKPEIILKDEDNKRDYETIKEVPIINVKIESQIIKQHESNTSEEQCKKSESKPKKPRVRPKESNNEFLCKICKISFTNIKLLRKHVSDKHNLTYTCNICDIKFKKRKAYDRHMYNHSICVTPDIPFSQITKFDCKMCGKSYRTINELRSHRNIHTKENVYICDICKKEFYYKSSLTKHILWHMGRNKQHMCDTCGNSFNDSSYLNKHIITVHKKLKLFKCTLCSKEFAANKTLTVHMRIHTGERPYKCETCDKTFICSTNLANHRKKHQKKPIFNGLYICKICKASFDHRGLYLTHLRSHVTSRKHKCTHCEDSFTTGFSLKRHMETHIGVKKYPCDKCDRKFTTKSRLRCHGKHHDPNRTKKVKIEKVNCKLCKKVVTDMEKHMNTHYNRRHQCDFCDKAYAERNTLNRHVRQYHDGVRQECDVCGKSFVNITSLKIHKMKLHNIEVKKSEEE